MSAVRPYYLLGQRQLDLLAEQIRIALTPLLRQWWPTDDTVPLVVAISNFADDESVHEENIRYFAQRDDQWLALLGTERAWLAFAEGWLGCSVATASKLVQTLMEAFSVDVFNSLANNSAAPELRANLQWQHLPAAIAQPSAGTLLLKISANGVALKLLASPSLWPDLAELSGTRARKKLLACNMALEACDVHISVSLPIAQIPLTDIATLAVGDFLNLGHDLSGQVHLRGNDIQLSLSATLGQSQTRKAIRLTEINNEKIA